MKNNYFFITILFTVINFVNAQTTTVTNFSTLIKSNHNFGITNPLWNENSSMTYNASQVDVLGAAFSIDYTNQGGTAFDGYPSGTVGGYKASGTYYSGNKAACGMPIQIKDLTHELRVNWQTSQLNAHDTDDKWWATINVIFDSGAETLEPDTVARDYDLVIQNVSYTQDDFSDLAIQPNQRYWYFARETPGGAIKPFTLYLNGVAYSWAVRYKFFNYLPTDPNADKNDKVHIKFIPLDNDNPIPYLDHSLKQFIDCTVNYLDFLPLTTTERALANSKVAESTLWIKSISAGYEVYEGVSTLKNDFFYTTLDNTAPEPLNNLVGVNQSSTAVLSWDASTDIAFDTYKVYRSENGGTYTKIASDLRTNTYTDNTVSNQYYSYFITSTDRSFNESSASNIISLNFSSQSIVSETFTTIDDAHVRIGIYANDNYGSNANMQLRETTTTDATRQAFLKFDLASIDNIISAVLRLRNTGTGTGSVDLNRVTDDTWLESTISWNNQPAIGANIGTYQFNAVGNFDIDVTSYVNTEIQGDKVISFALNNATSFMTVSSKEGELAPQLIVLYDDATTLKVKDFSKSDVVVYPNPTNSNVLFSIKKPDLDLGIIEVFDELGRLIQQTKITDSKMSIDLKGASGIYILKIRNKNNFVVKRVIKQ